MRFRLFKKQINVSIIAAGDIGQSMGAKLIETLKAGGIDNIKSLALNSGKRHHETDKIYDQVFSISDEIEGFARNLEIALENVKNWKDKIRPLIGKMIPKNPGIMFLITGAGATGVSSILTVSEILKNSYRYSPPVIFVFPDRFENSRVHYNTAQFLYKTVFSEDPLGNNILIVDNDPILEENAWPFERIAKGKIDYVNRGVTNLLISSFYDPYRENYDAGYDDLYDTLYNPGLSFLIHVPFEDLIKEGGEGNLRYVDILVDQVIGRTAMTRDEVLDSRKVYCAIMRRSYETIDLSYEAPRFLQSFENSPFLKLIKTGDELKNDLGVAEPSLNAIVSGVEVYPRLIQAFKIARDSRKAEILAELDLEDEAVELNIEKVESLEEKIEQLADLHNT
ncbi:MAG: hypothetical protein D6732_00320 [Methanobacteriota archaeon]|nr:MAG: hypothetical protein D6732_00320 [Euryarchaeota archaeon]